MQLAAPDILAEASQLSVAVIACAFVIGLLLWLFGWRGHRFWLVLAATIAGGIFGLYSGPAYGTHALVAGLLLAVAAGAMALSLIRLLAFIAGGIFAWFAVHALAPAWNSALVSFLIGGLTGLLLFRLWTMVLTSAAGTVLMTYSGLCLAKNFANLDIVDLAEKRVVLLNCLCAAITILGVVAQFVIDRRLGRSQPKRISKSRGESAGPSYLRGWWPGGQQPVRRAG
jgi:hypothetical protein